jgi:hypothetical protein
MELNFNGLPNDAIHVLGLRGEDGGIMKFDALSEVDSVFSHLLTLIPRSRIFSTMKMEAIRSSETYVHTRTTGCYIPENSILDSWGFTDTHTA